MTDSALLKDVAVSMAEILTDTTRWGVSHVTNLSNNDTSSPSGNDSEEKSKAKLLETNDAVALELLPVMLILGLFSILGVVGNGLVCFIFTLKFSKKTQNFLIISLAVFDLHTCILTIPYEIIDLRFYVYYIFDTDIICKIFKFVNTFCNSGSILVLLVIAIDRYRKVCKPLDSQFQLRSIRITFIVVFIVSTCYSIPIFFLYGYRTIESNFLHGTKSRDCSTPDGVKTLYPTLFNGFLFLAFVIISTALIIMYSKILAEVKRRNKHKKRNPPDKITCSDTNNSSRGTDDDQTVGNGTAPQNGADVSLLEVAASLVKQGNEAEPICDLQKHLSLEQLMDFDINYKAANSKKEISIVSYSYKMKYLNPGPVAKCTNGACLESGVPLRRSVSNITPEMQIKKPCAKKMTLQAGVTRSCSDPRPTRQAMARRQVPAGGLQDLAITDITIGQKTIVETGKRSASSRKRRRAKQQTTLVAFSVTTVFILSYLPHLALMITKLVIFLGFDLGLEGAAFVAYNVFVRSYFVNSVCNPFIYGILNAQFRLEVKRILKRICCRGV